MRNKHNIEKLIEDALSLEFSDVQSFFELADRVNKIISFAPTCGGNAFSYTNHLTLFNKGLRHSSLTSKAGFENKKRELKSILSGIFCA